ncbi:hypothetical protein [Ensifer aridi]|uniref:hypothetical protein n=1 Tax=Ensifer aridi TaxID=1708715 RepID=UPI000A11A4AB|nr:hypothetical protein [Ensifer aridi]
MRIGALREWYPEEARVALTPESAVQLRKLGHNCFVEAGAGSRSGISDDAYRSAGVEVVPDAMALIAASDVVVKVRGPEGDEAKGDRRLTKSGRQRAVTTRAKPEC